MLRYESVGVLCPADSFCYDESFSVAMAGCLWIESELSNYKSEAPLLVTEWSKVEGRW
jgi:hypothetical protein